MRPDRRRRWIVRVIVLLPVIYTFVLAIRHGHILILRWQERAFQDQFLRDVTTLERVVWEEDPKLAENFLKSPDFVPIPFNGDRSAGYLPKSWGDFLKHWNLDFSLDIPNQVAIVFARELSDENGARYLFVIYLQSSSRDSMDLALRSMVIKPATWGAPPTMVGGTGVTNFQDPSPFNVTTRHSYSRIYSGQADPADPHRFSIRFRRDGVDRVFNGRLVLSGSNPRIEIWEVH